MKAKIVSIFFLCLLLAIAIPQVQAVSVSIDRPMQIQAGSTVTWSVHLISDGDVEPDKPYQITFSGDGTFSPNPLTVYGTQTSIVSYTAPNQAGTYQINIFGSCPEWSVLLASQFVTVVGESTEPPPEQPPQETPSEPSVPFWQPILNAVASMPTQTFAISGIIAFCGIYYLFLRKKRHSK